MTSDQGDRDAVVGSGGTILVDRPPDTYRVLVSVVTTAGHATTVSLPLPEDARALAAALNKTAVNADAARARHAARLLTPPTAPWR